MRAWCCTLLAANKPMYRSFYYLCPILQPDAKQAAPGSGCMQHLQTTKDMSISGFFKKIFSPLLMGNCLGMIVVAILLAAGMMVFLNIYTHHGTEIEVPDICGLDEETAKHKLEALGLKCEVTDTGYVYKAAPFTVLEQSMKPGEKVKPGRIIGLTVNADGPRKVTLPDIADNCSRREAEDKLRVLGFKLGATEYITGDTDWVYGVKVNGKNVTAGMKVSINSPIVLVVGAGGMDYEYNGNDSLDYILNDTGADEEIIENEPTEAKHRESL